MMRVILRVSVLVTVALATVRAPLADGFTPPSAPWAMAHSNVALQQEPTAGTPAPLAPTQGTRDNVKGDPRAPVVIEEWGDFQ